jgi:type I restriction enzyme S subunit
MKTFVLHTSEDHVTEKTLNRLSLVPKESVLVVVRSGILSRTLPVALNSVAVTINQDMRAFIPESGISAKYLAWQLVAKEQEVLARCSKHGTTVASIEGPALARFPMVVAPAAEQIRIVEKLEELLSDLDAGVAELKAAQKKLAQYRQSLLKAAVEGALTAEWRAKNNPRETGAQLLERILKERRARWEAKQLAKFKEQGKTPPKNWQSKYPEPVKPDTSNLPELPEGWAWTSLDQLAELITSGSRGWADYYAESGAMFIRSQNINKDWLDLTDVAFVSPPQTSEGVRTLVQRNDVLLTITGANVGKVAHVDVAIEEAYVSQHVSLIRLVDSVLSKYLHLFLTARAGGRGQLDELAYGAGKPGLNLQQIASVVVPIPSADEIDVIIETVAFYIGRAYLQEAAIDHSLKHSAAQRKNILKAAFSGHLVPQDPNDEPASVLLERIRAERAKREKEHKARKRAVI